MATEPTVTVLPGRRVPADMAPALRRLADQIENGQCTGLVLAAIVNGDYDVRSGSSMTDSVVLSALLMDWSVRRIRGEAK